MQETKLGLAIASTAMQLRRENPRLRLEGA